MCDLGVNLRKLVFGYWLSLIVVADNNSYEKLVSSKLVVIALMTDNGSLITPSLCSSASKKIQYGHADCNAIFYLIENDRMFRVSGIATYFDTSINWAGVHDHNLLFQIVECLFRDAVVERIFS